jgi:hypothetical protein
LTKILIIKNNFSFLATKKAAPTQSTTTTDQPVKVKTQRKKAVSETGENTGEPVKKERKPRTPRKKKD